MLWIIADTITSSDAYQQLSTLLGLVEAGESFVITRRGVAVVRLALVPELPRPNRTPEHARAAAETLAFIATLTLRSPPADLPAGWPHSRDDLHAERLR